MDTSEFIGRSVCLCANTKIKNIVFENVEFLCLAEYPFLNYFGQRGWAEHDLLEAEKLKATYSSLPETNAREHKLKKRAFQNIDDHLADIKAKINKLDAGQTEQWRECAAELTKYFYKRK